MEADFEWETLDPDELAERFEALNDALASNLESAGEDIAELISAQAAENAPEDQAELKNSIDEVVEVTAGAMLRVEVGTDDTPKGAVHEFGADPFWPPISPLRDWAARNLGDPDAAWAVQRKIAEEGLPAQEWLSLAFEEHQDTAFDMLENAIENAFAEVGLA